MKNIVIILLLILAALYGALYFLSAGDNYNGERLYYRAMMANEKVTKNPDIAPAALLNNIESDFKVILDKYQKAPVARPASIALTEFYINHNKYDKALGSIALIGKRYKDDPVIMSTALFMKGAICEKKGEWPAALKEFRGVQRSYPFTQIGMQMPLYIGQYYDSKGDEANARAAYNEAATYYDNLEKKYNGKVVGYIAASFLLQTYLVAGSYDAAGIALEKIISQYPSGQTYAQFLPYVELIYLKKSNNPGKAIELYRNVKSITKDKLLIKSLDDAIQKVENRK